MITRLARTPPVSLAPASIVRSPWTLTSPLKWPAMRTWPVPSILPSMVRSDGDQRFLGLGVDGAARRGGDGGRIRQAAGDSRKGGGSGVKGAASFLAVVCWLKIAMALIPLACTEWLPRTFEPSTGLCRRRCDAGPQNTASAHGLLHAEYAETACARSIGAFIAADKPEAEHAARVGRIDDAVVPQPRRRVLRAALGFVLLADRRLERVFLVGAPCRRRALRCRRASPSPARTPPARRPSR